jgi:8-oxo-dGTP diphosphatase
MTPNGIGLRCSVIVFRKGAVLLVHRTYGSTGAWALPGGTPREGESMAACARRELLEETGMSADPARVAFVLEAVAPAASRRTLDIVFLATGLMPGAEPHAREPGLEPHFIPADQLNELELRPPVAGHLRGLLAQGARRYAPYLGNLWRPAGSAAAQPEVAVSSSG